MDGASVHVSDWNFRSTTGEDSPDLSLEEKSAHSSQTIIEKSIASSGDDDGDTCWRDILVGTVIAFLSAVQHNMILAGQWPYMSTIDKEATTNFFGIQTSTCGIGHAVFVMFFACYGHHTRQTKCPLLMGRFFVVAACFLFLFVVEFLPSNRRYALAVCYFLFFIGFNSPPLMRNYIAVMSSTRDRTTAYALLNLANMVSLMFSPVGTLLFSQIDYPGFKIFNQLNFHLYTAPVWTALILTIFNILITVFFFRDPKLERIVMSAVVEEQPSMTKLFQELKTLHKAPFPWVLVFVCLFQKVVANLSPIVFQTIGPPLMMAMFGFDGQLAMQVYATGQGLIGFLALLLSIYFVFFRISQRVTPWMYFAIAAALNVVTYIASYPYQALGRSIPLYNATLGVGCNPSEYVWCESTTATSPYVFIAANIFALGAALPLANISLDSIYSKILGKIDQTVMQGMFVVAEDLTLILGPMYVTRLFTAAGQSPLWTSNAFICTLGLLIWLSFRSPLRQYL